MSLHLLADTTTLGGIGGFLSGIGELLLVIGGALGFLVKSRKNARAERARVQRAAESAMDQKEAELNAQFKQQIADQQKRIESLEATNASLLDRILKRKTNDD